MPDQTAHSDYPPQWPPPSRKQPTARPQTPQEEEEAAAQQDAPSEEYGWQEPEAADRWQREARTEVHPPVSTFPPAPDAAEPPSPRPAPAGDVAFSAWD
ncbi:MAG: hypothetical protein ACRDXX_22100, partial [Stackebrandtia sp.]